MAQDAKNKKIEEKEKKEISLVSKRVTEKSALIAEKGAYTFNVPGDANKKMIAQMVKKEYKVTPVRVNIARATVKSVRRKGGPGFKAGSKKAVVFLKKGEKIEFV